MLVCVLNWQPRQWDKFLTFSLSVAKLLDTKLQCQYYEIAISFFHKPTTMLIVYVDLSKTHFKDSLVFNPVSVLFFPPKSSILIE